MCFKELRVRIFWVTSGAKISKRNIADESVYYWKACFVSYTLHLGEQPAKQATQYWGHFKVQPDAHTNVTKVTETSVRFDDNTLKGSSDRKVQVPKMWHLSVIMALISLVIKGCLVL